MDIQPNPPEGFEAFWSSLAVAAEAFPLSFEIREQDQIAHDGHHVRLVDFQGRDGVLHGWVATPRHEVKASPGFLWLAPYSRWSMLPNEYGTRAGLSSLSFNFFGEDAFHEEVYTPKRGYFAEGVESPESWIFGRMAFDAIVAGRVLAALDEVDEGRIGVSGMSQGGGMSIWLGAVWPVVKAVVAEMPFLGGMDWVLGQNRPFRYPLKELTDVMQSSAEMGEKVRRTVSFFDTVNLAAHCRVPTRVTLGLKDPAVRPEQARAVFAALPGEKEIEELDWGHDWHPRMVEGGSAWFERFL